MTNRCQNCGAPIRDPIICEYCWSIHQNYLDCTDDYEILYADDRPFACVPKGNGLLFNLENSMRKLNETINSSNQSMQTQYWNTSLQRRTV